jgi:multiple RNA-binding domain-containing protein 1
METTRVIVKNLSRTCTGDDLRNSVKSLPVTDARVVVSKNGSSRRFGFIGFKSSEDAKKAISLINNTYIGTSKVVASFALPVGDNQIPSAVGKLSQRNQKQRETGKLNERILTPEEEECLLDHGRIHVINLPHAATKEEIEAFFSKFGTVREVHIVMDEDLGRPRGMAFVTFVFPKDSVRAVKEGDMGIFQGRLIRVNPAQEKVQARTPENGKDSRMTDFQSKRLEKKRAEATSATHTWNLLFVSANAAASALIEQLDGDIDRSDLLLGSSAKDDVAVKAAIAETEILTQTKEWLRQNGITASAFERTGTSLLTASPNTNVKRSNDTLIIKHLPTDVELDSLRFMFTRNGETLVRFLLAPSRTVAIAQFADSGSAKRSFNANAFRKYKSTPLYIEWAPEQIFTAEEATEEKPPAPAEETTTEESEEPVKPVKGPVVKLDDSVQTSRLCVRNVAFEATSKDIRKLFSAYGRVVSVRLPIKMSAAGDASTGLRKQHRGFAFVEFTSRAEMVKAYEALQSTHLYGRKLVLEPAAMEDGSVEAARIKAQRRGDLASGAVSSESKKRKIDIAGDAGDDEAFDELLM